MNDAELTAEELRELIREGHGLVKDLTRIIKEVRAVTTEAQQYVAEAHGVDRTETIKAVNQVIEEAKEAVVKDTVPMIEDINSFVEKVVFERFDLLMNVILGDDRGTRAVTIPEALRATVPTPPGFEEALLSPTRPKGGVPHRHTEYVQGCARCDLSRKESK